tara:strand:+ start:1121 stop:1645 length:525 start_codon:yes stop_codon:yes gene_type:complete
MAGSLIEIQKTTLSTPTASVVLTGINSTYDVYMVRVSNVQPVTDNKNMIFRITKSGTAQSNSEYDTAGKNLNASSSFGNSSGTNATSVTFAFSLGNGTGEKANAILYLFNFANANEFSFITAESSFLDLTPNLVGFQGGFVHTVASASDGVSFEMESSVNINTGAEFTLYGLAK